MTPTNTASGGLLELFSSARCFATCITQINVHSRRRSQRVTRGSRGRRLCRFRGDPRPSQLDRWHGGGRGPMSSASWFSARGGAAGHLTRAFKVRSDSFMREDNFWTSENTGLNARILARTRSWQVELDKVTISVGIIGLGKLLDLEW